MPSAAIIIPISYNDDKSKSESISAMSDGQSFKARGHSFCFVRDIFLCLFSPRRVSPQGGIRGMFLLRISLSPDITFPKSSEVIVCVHLVNSPVRNIWIGKFFVKKKKKKVNFCLSYSNTEQISTATCPGRRRSERPTGVRINTRHTWLPPQRAAMHRSV